VIRVLKRTNKKNMQYELHYGNGGHGGPYANLDEAKEAAIRLLKGSKSEHSIQIRQGVAGPLVTTVQKIPSWLKAARCGTHVGYEETIEIN
jgi:hypothetical protein